jgi:hypothetical protein
VAFVKVSALGLAWCAEFLLETDLQILLRKTGTRLNLKIVLISLHIDPGPDHETERFNPEAACSRHV